MARPHRAWALGLGTLEVSLFDGNFRFLEGVQGEILEFIRIGIIFYRVHTCALWPGF